MHILDVKQHASNTATMSSQDIAELVGSRHDSVKLTIHRLASEQKDALGNVKRKAVIQLPPMEEVKNHLGQTVSVYLVCKRDSFVVVAQLCPEFTARLVDRWQELESQQFAIPSTLSSALRLAAEQAEVIEAQTAQLALAAPKAAFVDQYVEASGSMSFRQAAKLLNANERQFRQLLLDKGAMYYLGGVLTPYSQHQDAGRFEVKTGTSDTNGHAFSQSRFTAKGVQWVAGLWAAYQVEVAA